jgi:hypothetical protein
MRPLCSSEQSQNVLDSTALAFTAQFRRLLISGTVRISTTKGARDKNLAMAAQPFVGFLALRCGARAEMNRRG